MGDGAVAAVAAGDLTPAPVLAVFAYGTLRGDYCEDGDRWGLIERTGASWRRGTAQGFRLHQDSRLFYPFAVQTGDPEDLLVGTLLEWPDDQAARDAIAECDGIEGFDPARPESGLYRRAVADVTLDGEQQPRRAFVYHQLPRSSAEILHFPGGDWLEGRGRAPGGGAVAARLPAAEPAAREAAGTASPGPG